VWPLIRPHAHLAAGRYDRLDFLQLPDDLRERALQVLAQCVSCGAVVNPLRARAASKRSRVAGTSIERRLFYAATCPQERDSGCTRTREAKRHMEWVRAFLSGGEEAAT
jgi:hypothetical protein